MIVQAAVARHPAQPLAIETLDQDEPRADEVLVRLVASGVSQADLVAIADGSTVPCPFVPGGEGAGIVERVGKAVSGLAPGDAVVLTFASCGECPACSAGEPHECAIRADLNTSGRRRDGSAPFLGDGADINGFFQGQSSFSTHVLCHHSCAIKVASEAPLELLACLGGALQATAAILIRGYGLKAEDSIVITGAGAEGLVATMVAAALGVKTIVVADPREERRALATDLGATLVVHTDDDLASVVKSLTGAGAGYGLDTTGHEAAIEACRASLAPDGLFGATEMVATPAAIIAILVEWHGEGRFPLETLVTFFPFEHINDALAALADNTAVKPIVRFAIGSFGDFDRADQADADIGTPADDPIEPAEAHDPAPVTAV